MHQHWLYAGRYYRATEDEYTVYGDHESDCIKQGSVVFCVKVAELPIAGNYAILEDYNTGHIYSYGLKKRPERINFVAINPSILETKT